MTTVNVPTRVTKEQCYCLSPLSEIAGYKKMPQRLAVSYLITARQLKYQVIA